VIDEFEHALRDHQIKREAEGVGWALRRRAREVAEDLRAGLIEIWVGIALLDDVAHDVPPYVLDRVVRQIFLSWCPLVENA
jgi:hypothetical protein